MENNKKSKRTLLYLFAIFVIPLLVAIVMFIMRDQLTLVSPSVHGQLIHPAKPITKLEFKLSTQEMVSHEYLLGKWTYLLYLTSACDLECEAALFKIRQARFATGKDINRVQYIILQSSNSEPVDQEILDRHHRLVVGELFKWETSVGGEQQEKLQDGVIYIVDPFGNLMMSYDLFSTSKGMLKDLKKLLRTSNIG